MKNSSYLWLGAIGIVLIVAFSFFFAKGPAGSDANVADATASTTETTTSGGGSGSTRNDHSAPIVTTLGFASVSSTTAAVVGTVIPGDANTTYWFEYGTTLAFGSQAKATSAQASDAQIGTSGYLTGLTPNTQYYFRAGAKNAYGTVYSGAYSFITLPK